MAGKFTTPPFAGIVEIALGKTTPNVCKILFKYDDHPLAITPIAKTYPKTTAKPHTYANISPKETYIYV